MEKGAIGLLFYLFDGLTKAIFFLEFSYRENLYFTFREGEDVS
jgi:hypothetical protein